MHKLSQQLRNNPDGRAGVQRAIGEYIGGTRPAGFDATAKDIPSNRNTIDAIGNVLKHGGDFLDDAQRQVLENVQRELKLAEAANTGGKLTKHGYIDHTIPGPSSTARLIRFLAAKFSNHAEVQAVIKEAMLDPQKAKDLLGRPTPDRIGRWTRTIRRSTAASIKASQQLYPDTSGLTGTVTDTGEY
jgi:hypothetical protein